METQVGTATDGISHRHLEGRITQRSAAELRDSGLEVTYNAICRELQHNASELQLSLWLAFILATLTSMLANGLLWFSRMLVLASLVTAVYCGMLAGPTKSVGWLFAMIYGIILTISWSSRYSSYMLVIGGLLVWMISCNSLYMFVVLFELITIVLLLKMQLDNKTRSRRMASAMFVLILVSGISGGLLLLGLHSTWQGYLVVCVSMLVKGAVFPFHAQIVDVHSQASTVGSVVLSSLYVKVGLLGIIKCLRYSDVSSTAYSSYNASQVSKSWLGELAYNHGVRSISIIGIVGMILLLIKLRNETDMKRIIAISTALHSNQCVVLLFNCNKDILNTTLVFTVQHSVCSAIWFMVAGYIIGETNSKDSTSMKGLGTTAISWLMFITVLCAINFPITVGFIGEIGSLSSLSSNYPWMANAVLILATLKALLIMAWFTRIAFSGGSYNSTSQVTNLNINVNYTAPGYGLAATAWRGRNVKSHVYGAHTLGIFAWAYAILFLMYFTGVLFPVL